MHLILEGFRMMDWIASRNKQLWPILMQSPNTCMLGGGGGVRRTMRNLHLTAWGRVLHEKLIVICVVQKFPILSKTKIYCYITVCHPYTPGITAPSSPGPPPCWCFTFTLRHTTLGTAPLDGWLAQLRDLYLRTHVTLVRQTFMQLVGFESAIPASKGP